MSSLRQGVFLLTKQKIEVPKEPTRSVTPAGQLERFHTGILRTCLLLGYSIISSIMTCFLDSWSSFIEQGFLLTALLIIHLFSHPFMYPSLLIQLSFVFSCTCWQLFSLTAHENLCYLICSFFSLSFFHHVLILAQ